MAERSSAMPPRDSGTPRTGSPISIAAFSTASGAAQASSASAAAGRTTSAANPATRSTSCCSSSVGFRSKTPWAVAAGARTPGTPGAPRLVNARLAVVSVRKPLRVTTWTARSAGPRSPTRSSSSLWASRLRPATSTPIGSRDSAAARPCVLEAGSMESM